MALSKECDAFEVNAIFLGFMMNLLVSFPSQSISIYLVDTDVQTQIEYGPRCSDTKPDLDVSLDN